MQAPPVTLWGEAEAARIADVTELRETLARRTSEPASKYSQPEESGWSLSSIFSSRARQRLAHSVGGRGLGHAYHQTACN